MLIIYILETESWSAPKVSGNIPEARDGHSACVIGDTMYIFAGYLDLSDIYTKDIHALNLKTLNWYHVCSEVCIPH